MSFPGMPVVRTPDPAPLEGQDVGTATGMWANWRQSFIGTLGESLETKALGQGARLMPGGNEVIPHDEAVKRMKSQGWDSSVLPDGDIHAGALLMIEAQQSSITRDRDLARRAHLGSTSSFVTSLGGGMADPLFIGLGPIAGRVGTAFRAATGVTEGAGLATRVVTGAAEGGAVLGGYTEAEKQFGTAPGDRDITSYDVLRGFGYGAILGGGIKAAFGKRLTLDTTRSLEGSADTAVSPKGAIGRYQVTPDTARQYMGKDFDVSTLRDPVVNGKVAQIILDDLEKRFPGDREAQAVAYNAGPGKAEEWIKAGRNDDVLKPETQKYLAHLRRLTGEGPTKVSVEAPPETGAKPPTEPTIETPRPSDPLEDIASLPPQVRTDAAKTAVAQAANDSDVNVEPVIKAGVEGDTSRLAEAIPKSGSVLTGERLSADLLARINAEQKVPGPPLSTPEARDAELSNWKSLAADAEKQAEHAHRMAFGDNARPFKDIFEKVQADHINEMLPDKEDQLIHQTEDLPKAIEAAVQCSIIKGAL